MKELLKTLCALNGVSGDEDQVREFLAERARPWARSMKVDPLGNLIVWKKGARAAGDRLMLCAHMDEVGLIVTHVTEEGFLKFDFVGGVDRRVAIGKPVVLGPDRVPGVVGIKAIHLVSRDEEKKVPKTDAFYLDIGARDREEALSRVEPGTYGSFVCTPEEFGEGLFKAKAIDDRVGCAVLLKLLEHPRVFPDEGQERAWVIRMAVNVCKNLKKSAWFRRTVGLEEGLHLTVQVPPEEESEVLPLVQQLPLKYRRVLYLRYYEGYQVGEIAALLGVRPALVSTHLTRARAKLKIMLEDEGYGKTIPE